MPRRKHFLFVMLLACTLVLGGGPSHAREIGKDEIQAFDPIPVVLTREPDPSGYIQPTCSKCKHVSVQRQLSSTSEVQGVLELTYFDDVYEVFEGSIHLTVLLANDTEHEVSIDGVLLVEGEEVGWVIEAPAEWSWDRVDMIWLELVPAPASAPPPAHPATR